MSVSWNPDVHSRVRTLRGRVQLVAMILALALFAASSAAVAAVILYEQRARFEVAARLQGPAEWGGMRIELVEFRTFDTLPGDARAGSGDVAAPNDTTFVLATVRQTVTDASSLGIARLDLGRGEQRWTMPATEVHPDPETSYSPLIPRQSVGLSPFSEPAPRTGQSIEFGQLWLVPTRSLGDTDASGPDAMRPVVTVEANDYQQRPREIWL